MGESLARGDSQGESGGGASPPEGEEGGKLALWHEFICSNAHARVGVRVDSGGRKVSEWGEVTPL